MAESKKRKAESEESGASGEVKMQTIGIIGGLSYVSSLDYYRTLNQEVNRSLGGLHSSKIALYSVDLHECQTFIEAGDFDSFGKILGDAAQRILKMGADFLILACNTAHVAYPYLTKLVPSLPILHIADPTAVAVKEKGITMVGLLASRATVENPRILADRLRAHGLKVVIPSKESAIIEMGRIITVELSHSIFKQESKKVFLDEIAEFRKQGAQGVILGCTEIGFLLKEEDVPDFPLFDTASHHVQAAWKIQLGKAVLDTFSPVADS